MDETKKYIEMSLAAISYFGLKPPEPADFIALETRVGSGEFRVMSGLQFWRQLSPNLDPLTMNRQWVKLLRQDQLQEIIIREQGWELHPRDIKTLLHNICLSIENGLLPFDKHGLYSMEQLWLAFVMKEKYKKIWNGEKWIVKEDKP